MATLPSPGRGRPQLPLGLHVSGVLQSEVRRLSRKRAPHMTPRRKSGTECWYGLTRRNTPAPSVRGRWETRHRCRIASRESPSRGRPLTTDSATCRLGAARREVSRRASAAAPGERSSAPSPPAPPAWHADAVYAARSQGRFPVATGRSFRHTRRRQPLRWGDDSHSAQHSRRHWPVPLGRCLTLALGRAFPPHSRRNRPVGARP